MDHGLNGASRMARQSKPMAKKSKPKSDGSSAPRTLTARVTHLEMTSPAIRAHPVPTRPSVALITAKNIPAAYYAYLYELVGKPHHWEERRNMNEDALGEAINAPECAISVLYADGCPAGFFELDLKEAPKQIELKYLGIAPDYQGLGLGKWFMATAISSAWAHKPERVTLQTNTLDHPAALPLYQKLGFSPVGISEAEILAWD